MSQNDNNAKLIACETLRSTKAFHELSPGAMEALVEASELLLLPEGTTLFHAGEKYRKVVYVLVQGEMLVERTYGRAEQVQPGEFIGLANYIDHHDYLSSAHAVTQATLLAVSADLMSRMEHERPDFFNVVNRVIAGKLRERNPDRSIAAGILAQPVTRVMKSPVAYCGPETNLRDALMTMKGRRIGSMVVKDRKDNLLGLLTYAGLAEAAILEDARPEDSIMAIACEVPTVLQSDTPLWETEMLMEVDHAKYAIVCEGNVPIGIVSKTDILQILVSRPSTLSNRIRDAHTIPELASLSGKLVDVAANASETNRRPSTAVRLLSETHLMLQNRVVELTLDWMKHKGFGKPPADFAILIMGSGGRREMLLGTDQDNGIIIGEILEEQDTPVDEWFERFAKRLNRNLDRVGYPLCPGEIMLRNPLYRKTLGDWKKQLSGMTSNPSIQDARWANVVLDFDTLYGNDALTIELRRHLLRELSRKPGLLKLMAEDDAEGRPALGIFNQLVTTRDEKGEHIDLKRNGLRIIADAARIFALQNGIAVQNTSDRLNALVRIGKLSGDFTSSIQEAYEEMLDLLLRHQIHQASAGKEPSKQIKLEKLSPKERSSLRMAMRAVKRFQEQLQDEYSGELF